MPIPVERRNKVFVSYSHKDSYWLERLQVHLKPLTRDGQVDLWDDTRLQTGTKWREEIRKALDSACAAILLISADFLASDFIAEDELPPLLAAAEKEGVVILPLILSPSRYEQTESLSQFMSVNKPSEPLIDLSKGDQERYLVKLSNDVQRVVEEAERKAAEQAEEAARRAAERAEEVKRKENEQAERENLRIFKLPFPRNKYFTGRDEILESLHANFNADEPVQALSGLGGMGKTQTALEYGHRYKDEYRFVFWARAQARETMVADFAAIAEMLNLPEGKLEDQNYAVSAVKRWLEGNQGWLLILDNADEWSIVDEFIPPAVPGHILLTTQVQNTRPIAARQPLEKMEPKEGALYLLRRIGKLKKDELLESATEELRKQAEALSKAVDGLPLALDQAAAFIEETPSSLEEYLQLYQSEGTRLLAERGESNKDHKDPVTVTFSLAFKKVAEANQAAADLLRLCAFLDADAIPEEIFGGGVDMLGRVLAAAVTNPINLTKTIKEAGRYSLLKRDPETRMVSLHRLVQAVIKDEMGKRIQRLWAERTVRVVSRVFPDANEINNWHLVGRLISHAQVLVRVVDEFDFEFPSAIRLIQETGSYFHERGYFAEAEPICKYALALSEKALGSKHPNVARILNIVAVLYNDQGKYTEAEPLFRRALSISEKAHGSKHQIVGLYLNNLAVLYFDQGKYAEAELLHKRALAIREKEFGLDDPHVATSLNNLALLYHDQGKYAKAELLSRRSLVIKEKAFGPGHPTVAICLNTLAKIYFKQGKYEEAEPHLKRALAIQEKALGLEHPNVAHSLHNLANLYAEQGKDSEVELLFQRALAIREKTLGTEHPDVATVLEDYASLLRKIGKEVAAVELEARASTIRANV